MGFKYDEENRIHRLMRIVAIATASLFALVLIWWVISIAVDRAVLPTPIQVFNDLLYLMTTLDPATGRTMWEHVTASLQRFGLGFLITFALAVPLGLLIGYSKTLYDFTKPVIEVLRPIAPIAWSPIFIMGLLFGSVFLGQVMVVVVGMFFPLLTNTIFGVQKIESNLIDAAKTLGATKLQTFYKVMFPCTVPYIMSGIKIGLGIGWMCIIAAEMIVNTTGTGLGFFIYNNSVGGTGSWSYVFVGIILISILGILTTGIAEYAHKVVSKRTGLE